MFVIGQKELRNIKRRELGDEDAARRWFMFNIADGGCTKLHIFLLNEEKMTAPGREY